MKKEKDYEQLYRINPTTNRVIIDIALDEYLDFFHEWDNSAFKKRDINSELVQFLDLCSSDIPLSKKLQITYTVDFEGANGLKETQIRESFRNYYDSMYRLETKITKRYLRTSILLLIVSLSLLTVYGLLFDYQSTSIVFRVLRESLLIGGWVFAWEAVHLIFIDIIEPLHRLKEIKRFKEAELVFAYKQLKS